MLINWPDLRDWESYSDDGSDYEVGDTYLDLYVGESVEENDETYDPVLMEQDVEFNFDLEWFYEDISQHDKPSPSHDMYDGIGPALKRGVVTSFQTAMKFLAKCGGMHMEFFWHLTANINEYAQLHKDERSWCFDDSKWLNIGLEDMIHLFGIVLKMNIDQKLGGYKEYFDDSICADLAEGT